MTSMDRQDPSTPEAPLAELRVRVTGLGEWGTRIAELLGDSGLEARAIDNAVSVRRAGLDPGRIHHLQVESRTAGRWAALSRALSSDADLQAGLAADADCDLMMVAADVSTGAGVMLATLMKRMVKAAPGVSRLAIARLPETRSSPDRRARALVAVNALGRVTVGEGPQFWAAPWEMGGEFGGLGLPGAFDAAAEPRLFKTAGAGSIIAIVATDAALTQAQAQRMATAAHDGMARAIVPSHTPMDGDLVFAAATGARPLTDALKDPFLIGHAAAACLARAIARGVHAATARSGDLAPTWAARFGDG